MRPSPGTFAKLEVYYRNTAIYVPGFSKLILAATLFKVMNKADCI